MTSAKRAVLRLQAGADRTASATGVLTWNDVSRGDIPTSFRFKSVDAVTCRLPHHFTHVFQANTPSAPFLCL